MNKIASHAIALVTGGLIVAAGCAYLKFKPSLPSVLAEPSKDLAKVDKETLKCKDLIVYKDKAKKELGLPETSKADPYQKVLAATQVRPNERPTTVSAVLNTGTGQTLMYQRLDPLPWLAFNRRATLGAAYGVKNEHDGAVLRVYGKLELLQVKAMRLGLLGDVDNASGYFAGGYLEASW